MSDRKNGDLIVERIYQPKRAHWNRLLERPVAGQQAMEPLLEEVFARVSSEGDSALRDYTRKFDGLDPDPIRVPRAVLENRAGEVDDCLREAIDLAYLNIRAFHEAQRQDPVSVETVPGVRCWQEKKPISRVGIYIPGGSAPLFSTVLMLAIPARIAGCSEIVLCTPPDKEGAVHPAICYAALKCGVTKVCRVGGIQAIAGLTHGTESVPAVYKIFGPGNQYVTMAKQWATRLGVAIDMPAGPSEVMIVADDTAVPSFVAADLLSQAEHGPDSQVVLLTDSENLAGAVENEVERQLKVLPRKDIAAAALANSKTVIMESREDLAEMVNAYAPEHLIICHRDEDYFLEQVQNAGSVFLGNFTPESAGDYASGTNHTLPTNGYARQYSGVNLDSYMKSITYQRISRSGLQAIGPSIETMAAAEGLEAHKRAVSLRLESAGAGNAIKG